jgi:hypothetical protein
MTQALYAHMNKIKIKKKKKRNLCSLVRQALKPCYHPATSFFKKQKSPHKLSYSVNAEVSLPSGKV